MAKDTPSPVTAAASYQRAQVQKKEYLTSNALPTGKTLFSSPMQSKAVIVFVAWKKLLRILTHTLHVGTWLLTITTRFE